MRTLAITLGVLVGVLVGAYAFATGGKPSREAPAWLTAAPIAHRGEWAEGCERPENSLAAFDEALRHGYSIELDVQRTADGVTVVIHDEDLYRLTLAPGVVSEMTYDELRQRRLACSDEMIPTLAEALSLIDAHVPVFVEIKNRGAAGALEDDVAEQLLAYRGRAAVMSFNPYSLARVAETAPEIPRGQLASAFEDEDLAWYEKFLLRNLMMNWTSKPDFIAYDLAELPSHTVMLQSWRGRPILGWTAKYPADREAAAKIVDAVICDPAALPR